MKLKKSGSENKDQAEETQPGKDGRAGVWKSGPKDTNVPFHDKQHSVLAVSKSWLGIGTPLVYHTIVLASLQQAKALAAAVKNLPQLGSTIRNLMVRGGFGKHLKPILASCGHHLKVIWLTSELNSKTTVAGLVSGLRLINPEQAIFQQERVRGYGCTSYTIKETKNQTALISVLAECIRDRWSHLLNPTEG
ncbi:hypothetical protein B0H13DRAFT_1874811 [Mycena leptocephala]|nr:hypothetical protein B0H13DRAFT_1874811 [Mycena leptocephala]